MRILLLLFISLSVSMTAYSNDNVATNENRNEPIENEVPENIESPQQATQMYVVDKNISFTIKPDSCDSDAVSGRSITNSFNFYGTVDALPNVIKGTCKQLARDLAGLAGTYEVDVKSVAVATHCLDVDITDIESGTRTCMNLLNQYFRFRGILPSRSKAKAKTKTKKSRR